MSVSLFEMIENRPPWGSFEGIRCPGMTSKLLPPGIIFPIIRGSVMNPITRSWPPQRSHYVEAQPCGPDSG